MIIVEINENETIERALKKYKLKVNRSGVLRELRERKHFTKPSVRRRNLMLKAVYRQQKMAEIEQV
jgi:small subunit ribosomal protein S21